MRIKTENLNFFYGPSRALKNVSIDCYDRTVTAISGPSGCRKSTFIRALTAFMMLGELVEFDRTEQIFTAPANTLTEDYITGRFG